VCQIFIITVVCLILCMLKWQSAVSQHFERWESDLLSQPSLTSFFSLYFFLSFSVWPLLTNHSRCGGLLLHLITLIHTHIYTHTNIHIHSAEISTLQHTTFTRDRLHVSGGIRTHNHSKRAAADPQLAAIGSV
jgi:hypothetical protein